MGKLLNKSVIILGGGGHASVLIEILRLIDSDIIGIVDPFLEKGIKVKDITVIGSDDAVLDYPNSEVVLVNALGPLPKKSTRENCQQSLSTLDTNSLLSFTLEPTLRRQQESKTVRKLWRVP